MKHNRKGTGSEREWYRTEGQEHFCREKTVRPPQDPDIDRIHCSVERQYPTGYDKGHAAPDGDLSWSQQVEYESFLMTNMYPQHGSLNRGIWKLLETFLS